MSNNTLDEIDQEILDLLSLNSRLSYVDIGKKVKLSRVAVKNRIDIMKRDGIIERYSIIINPEKLGRMVSAYFNMEVAPEHLFTVANALAKKDQITDIYQMTGSSNLHVHAVMNLNEDLDRFLREELYKLPGIVRIECNVILSRIKTRTGIRI